MGDRVLFQVVSVDRQQYSPVLYCHWSGSEVNTILERLAKRMKGRSDDVEYVAARLVQEAINGDEGQLSFGIRNAQGILTAADSHGDAGVVLMIADPQGIRIQCFGGYLRVEDKVVNA